MQADRLAFSLVASLLALGCSGASARCPEGSPVGSANAAPSSSDKAAAPEAAPTLAVTITPAPTPAPHVDVEVELAIEPGVVATGWTMSRATSAALASPVVARDPSGTIPTSTTEDGDRVHVVLGRAPTARVTLAYAVRAQPPGYPETPAVAVDPDRFEGLAESLLLLPDAVEDRAVTTAIHVDTQHIGSSQYVSAASSFGVGAKRTTTLRGRDLRGGMFVAGILGKAIFDAPEGQDEAVWLGYTAFDPRPAAADMAGFRTAVHQLLKTRESAPAAILFLSDARGDGAFVVTRRTRSVVVRVGIADPWTGPMRIAASSALLHEWLGERLWIGPSDAAHEAEAYWFTEGLVRNVARDLLFHFGLITPDEAAAELDSLAAIAATSPLASLGNVELAARAHDPGATPLLVARGGLYAARIDALVRKKSGGKRNIEDILAALYAKAATDRAPLPTSAWVDAVKAELGDAEAATFTASIDKGAPIDVPDGALGPCFARVTRTYTAFDAGFDEAKTMHDPGRAVVGLDPKGPAAKAGLLATDVIGSIQMKHGRADVPVLLVVERGSEKKTIRYLPEGRRGKGQGWDRKKDVPDEECSR